MTKNLSEQKIKSFLKIQSDERFAKLFISQSPTKLIVLSKKEIYMFNDEFKYYQPVEMNGKLLSLVSDVLHQTIEPWSEMFENKMMAIKLDKELGKDEKDEESDRIKIVLKQITSAVKFIETTNHIKSVIEQIVSNLLVTKEQQEKLNRLDNHLNFRNGKLNLKTLEFSERTDEDFITEYLNYDFTPDANTDIVKKVKGILKQICNSDKDDYELITDFLGYCITTETKEQKYLNAVGPSASNGKSTLIKLVEEALSIYVFKAKKDLFSEAFSKGHKYFAQTKNKHIVYIEEQDKKKVDSDLIKDVVDGNKMNNEVLFSTTEKIDINFKLMFLSNNLMNFDADSGIKRRLIHFDFKNKFVAKDDYEKEKALHKIGEVFVLDSSLLGKFKDSDDYKNALIHILISKAKKYFDTGLKIPSKYVEIAKDMCEENDKFKNFFDNHFEITNKEEDRISKDELRDMFNHHTKCNYSASSVMTDIQRLQLKYEKGKCTMYNGLSIRGVIIGIKKKTLIDCDFVEETKNEIPHKAKVVHDLDFGLDMPYSEEKNDDVVAKLKEKEDEVLDLYDQLNKLRIEFENYKKENPVKAPEIKVKIKETTQKKAVISFIDEESDEEVAVVRLKDNKIVEALAPITFLD